MAIILTDDPLQKQQAAKQAALSSFNPAPPSAPSPVQSNPVQAPVAPVPQGGNMISRFLSRQREQDHSMDWAKGLTPAPKPPVSAPPQPVQQAKPVNQPPVGSFQDNYTKFAQSPTGQAISAKSTQPVPTQASPASYPAPAVKLPPVPTQQAPTQSKPFNNPFTNINWSNFFKNLGSKTATPAAIPTATNPNKSK